MENGIPYNLWQSEAASAYAAKFICLLLHNLIKFHEAKTTFVIKMECNTSEAGDYSW